MTHDAHDGFARTEGEGLGGRVAAQVAIPAPYPRDERFRTSADYAGYCRQVSEALEMAMAGEAG